MAFTYSTLVSATSIQFFTSNDCTGPAKSTIDNICGCQSANLKGIKSIKLTDQSVGLLIFDNTKCLTSHLPTIIYSGDSCHPLDTTFTKDVGIRAYFMI